MDGISSLDSLQAPLAVQPPPPHEELPQESAETNEPPPRAEGEGGSVDTYA